MKSLKSAMKRIKHLVKNHGVNIETEFRADRLLASAVKAEILEKLTEHSEKGRHGWWNPDVCSIEQLRTMRDAALKDDDHISVINFTAMIAAREVDNG